MLICFIFFGSVGIICILLGIKKAINIKEKINKSCRAVVLSCDETREKDTKSYIQNYCVSLEIETWTGPIRELIESEYYCLPGTECEVYSDRLHGYFEFKSDLQTKKRNALIVGIGSGLLFFTVIAFIWFGSLKTTAQVALGGVVVYLIGLGMSAVGGYNIIKLIVARKYEDVNKITGKIIDTVINGDKWDSRLRIYEFYENGVRRIMKATIDGVKRGRIGDEVAIVINKETGKAYCEKDYKQHIFFNSFFMFIGVSFIYMAFVIILFGK